MVYIFLVIKFSLYITLNALNRTLPFDLSEIHFLYHVGMCQAEPCLLLFSDLFLHLPMRICKLRKCAQLFMRNFS